MLTRLIIKNLYSFNEQTEFNLFPNKSPKLKHHKVKTKEFEFLRFSAVYGANGSGKSNLVKSISLIDKLVTKGQLNSNLESIKFKLDPNCHSAPSSLAVEFINDKTIFYYTLTFHNDIILHEYLAKSTKKTDDIIFERKFEEDKQSVKFYEDYYKTEKEKLFADILVEKLIQKNELLLTFLAKKYKNDFKNVNSAYNWFRFKLIIINPSSKPEGIAHLLDKTHHLKKFANNLLPFLNTGISNLSIETSNIEDNFEFNQDQLSTLRKDLESDPSQMATITNKITNEEISVLTEKDKIVAKRIITSHKNSNDEEVEFNVGMESDGTKRLIEYLPAINGIIQSDCTYIIDEIERSIHPNAIKKIVQKLSHDLNIKGQLIFTTHESVLLDQKILRTDEIWFAQKDKFGASKLYSLSDYKIHNTIDIQNGYLNGRYGGIPFLSNFELLDWNE
jgi:hypothetical protein